MRKWAYYGQNMSFFSNTQETAGRYGKYIPEFQELFQKHEVSFGTPKDFFRLAPKLAYDEDFRVEFTALVKSVGQREEGRLSLTQMLTIIAIAMGGTEVDEVGSAGAVPTSLVVVFLAEMGGWSEGEAAPAGAAEGEADDEREATELERRLALGQKDRLEGVAASLFSGPGMMKEALSRLELNTLQLKHHLDSIDTRMERIEPHLDDLTWRFATGEAATGERKRKTGTSGERPARFSSESEMRPWPTKKEEEPELAWERSAPPMRPWPVDREKEAARAAGVEGLAAGPEMAAASAGELANESVRETEKEPWVETARPRPASEWRAAVASLQERERREALLREALLPEPTQEAVQEPVLGWVREREAAESVPVQVLPEAVPVVGAAPEPVVESVPEPLLREPLVRELEPEPLLREPTVRVPFGEYLRDEEEEVSERRWGWWVVAALLLIGVGGGAMVYHRDGWQGFSDGWQHGRALVSAAVAKTRLAAGEAKALTAKPAASASVTPGVGSAAGSGGETASAAAPAPAPASTPASASASTPASASGQSAPVVASAPPAMSAARNEGPGTAGVGSGGAGSAGAGDGAPRTNALAQNAAAAEKRRMRVVVEEGGLGGAASSGGVAAAPSASAARVFGGAVAPVFVDASQLTVLSKTQPEYPDDALAQRVTGEVVVQAIISRTGAVESAQIVSGPAGLLKASLDAMKGWRYRPYLVNGEPVVVRTYVKFRFERDE